MIAHEVGHHVQNQLGIMEKVDAMRGRGGEAQANALSVRVELQADCFAGVWAKRSQQENGWRLDPGQASAQAISCGNDGTVYIVGMDNFLYQLDGQRRKLTVEADDVAVINSERVWYCKNGQTFEPALSRPLLRIA